MIAELLANPGTPLWLCALAYAVLAFLISVLVTPVVIRIASKLHLFDQPGARKVHGRPIPRLGGIAIFLALWITWGLFVHLHPNVIPYESAATLRALFLGSTLIFALGLYDDLHGANAYKKLAVQLVATALVVSQGVNINYLYNPFLQANFSLHSSFLSSFLAVAWIVVMTNAINLIDGLDGLAGGVCFITSITLFFISRDLGIPHLPYLCACLAGALLGFLIFNFSPARIFLGDSGSLVLGFLLASLSIEGTVKRSTAIVMFGPPVILALPMVDTVAAIVRRFLRQAVNHEIGTYRDMWRPRVMIARLKEIFEADQEHIHHALLKIGLSHRTAVLILYVVTAALGASAYRMAVLEHLKGVILVVIALACAFAWMARRVRKLSPPDAPDSGPEIKAPLAGEKTKGALR